MFRNHLAVAYRNLVKRKAGTVINVAGLSIGIAACLLIYIVTASELSFDRFHPDRERIYRVVADMNNPAYGQFYRSQVPYPAALALRDQFKGVETVTNFTSYTAKVSIPGSAKRFAGSYPSDIILADPDYFRIFPRQWLAGDAATALVRPFSVVLTEAKARSYFGDLPANELIGREVVYDDSLRLTVSGIVKDWNKNTDLIFRDFISYSTIHVSFLKDIQDIGPASLPNEWSWNDHSQVYLKLAKGVSPERIHAEMKQMFRDQLSGNKGWEVRMYLQPLSDIHFNATFTDFYGGRANLPTLYGLMGIAAFILLLAVVNFVNLSTAQSLQRAREIGVRKVLGSSRANLVFQFLTETFVLTLLAVMLSVLIAKIVMERLPTFFPEGTAFHVFAPYTLLFLAGITGGATLLAGFYPARVLSSWRPAITLKGYTRSATGHRNYLRKGLIVFQFTISLFFIIGALVVGSQLRYLLGKDLGFKKDSIVNIATGSNYSTDKRNVLAEKIRHIAGVRMASVSIETPMIDWLRGGDIKRLDNGAKVQSSERVADEYYVPLYGLTLVAGRNFQPPHDDTTGFITSKIPYGYTFRVKQAEFLINQTCARQLGFADPAAALGHMVDIGLVRGPVVGILKDFHERSLFTPIGPVYIYGSKNPLWGEINVSLNRGALQQTLAGIERCWKEVYPSEPFAYTFLDKDIERFYAKEEQTRQVVNAATLLAIFISCIGLFGLIRLTAEQRTKEIGIRKVLGASAPAIVLLLSSDFIKLVLLAVVVASPLAWYLGHRWLENFAYRIDIRWWMFVLSGALALAMAGVTVGVQALRAAGANPVDSLRAE